MWCLLSYQTLNTRFSRAICKQNNGYWTGIAYVSDSEIKIFLAGHINKGREGGGRGSESGWSSDSEKYEKWTRDWKKWKKMKKEKKIEKKHDIFYRTSIFQHPIFQRKMTSFSNFIFQLHSSTFYLQTTIKLYLRVNFPPELSLRARPVKQSKVPTRKLHLYYQRSFNLTSSPHLSQSKVCVTFPSFVYHGIRYIS